MRRSKFAKRLCELGSRIVYGGAVYELVRVTRDYLELTPWPRPGDPDLPAVLVPLAAIADVRLRPRDVLLTSLAEGAPPKARR